MQVSTYLLFELDLLQPVMAMHATTGLFAPAMSIIRGQHGIILFHIWLLKDLISSNRRREWLNCALINDAHLTSTKWRRRRSRKGEAERSMQALLADTSCSSLATGWSKRIIATNLKFWVQGMGIDPHNGKADLLSPTRQSPINTTETLHPPCPSPSNIPSRSSVLHDSPP